MKKLYNILVCILILSFSCSVTYASESIQSDSIKTEKDSAKSLDVSSILFGHIGDAYEYHITEIHEHPIAIPLPVIVYSKERGWFSFLSTKVTEGEAYNGFFIQKGGSYDGKIVETNSKGEIVRPFDLSITKNVFALLFSCFLLIVIFVPMALSYKKLPLNVPNKKQNLLEMVIMYIEDDVIKPSVGKKYLKYSPYLLTIFFFILINNLMGLIPIFPFGANLTGNISVTLILAMFTFFITNIFGTKEYWKEILWPDVPLMLKAPIPLMQMIEIISTLTKPFALMVRLFANIFAGHMIILVLTTLIFLFSAVMGAAMGYATVVISVLFSVFMYCLELLVAFIQAYVFTLLSAIFIGLAQVEPHHKTKKEEILSVAQVNKKND